MMTSSTCFDWPPSNKIDSTSRLKRAVKALLFRIDRIPQEKTFSFFARLGVSAGPLRIVREKNGSYGGRRLHVERPVNRTDPFLFQWILCEGNPKPGALACSRSDRFIPAGSSSRPTGQKRGSWALFLADRCPHSPDKTVVWLLLATGVLRRHRARLQTGDTHPSQPFRKGPPPWPAIDTEIARGKGRMWSTGDFLHVTAKSHANSPLPMVTGEAGGCVQKGSCVQELQHLKRFQEDGVFPHRAPGAVDHQETRCQVSYKKPIGK